MHKLHYGALPKVFLVFILTKLELFADNQIISHEEFLLILENKLFQNKVKALQCGTYVKDSHTILISSFFFDHASTYALLFQPLSCINAWQHCIWFKQLLGHLD